MLPTTILLLFIASFIFQKGEIYSQRAGATSELTSTTRASRAVQEQYHYQQRACLLGCWLAGLFLQTETDGGACVRRSIPRRILSLQLEGEPAWYGLWLLMNRHESEARL